MKIAAGCIALLIAAILLISAAVDYKADIDDSPHRITRDFADIHNDAALNHNFDEQHSRESSQAIRGVAGAAFLIAGLFILGTRKKTGQN